MSGAFYLRGWDRDLTQWEMWVSDDVDSPPPSGKENLQNIQWMPFEKGGGAAGPFWVNTAWPLSGGELLDHDILLSIEPGEEGYSLQTYEGQVVWRPSGGGTTHTLGTSFPISGGGLFDKDLTLSISPASTTGHVLTTIAPGTVGWAPGQGGGTAHTLGTTYPIVGGGLFDKDLTLSISPGVEGQVLTGHDSAPPDWAPVVVWEIKGKDGGFSRKDAYVRSGAVVKTEGYFAEGYNLRAVAIRVWGDARGTPSFVDAPEQFYVKPGMSMHVTAHAVAHCRDEGYASSPHSGSCTVHALITWGATAPEPPSVFFAVIGTDINMAGALLNPGIRVGRINSTMYQVEFHASRAAPPPKDGEGAPPTATTGLLVAVTFDATVSLGTA